VLDVIGQKHLGDDGYDRYKLGNLCHELHFLGLEVVGRQKEQCSVHTGVGQGAEGYDSFGILLLGHVIPVLLDDVLQNGVVYSCQVRAWGILHRFCPNDAIAAHTVESLQAGFSLRDFGLGGTLSFCPLNPTSSHITEDKKDCAPRGLFSCEFDVPVKET
jgi:hypothetical protein